MTAGSTAFDTFTSAVIRGPRLVVQCAAVSITFFYHDIYLRCWKYFPSALIQESQQTNKHVLNGTPKFNTLSEPTGSNYRELSHKLIYVYNCHIYINLSLHLSLEGRGVIIGVSIFSKNLKAASKFYVPNGWQETSSILRAQKFEDPPYKTFLPGWRGIHDLCTPVVIVLYIGHHFL